MSLLKALNLPQRASQAAPGAVPVSIAVDKPATFEFGARQQLFVTGVFSDGSTRNVATTVKWISSDEAIVDVLPGGLAQVGYRAGTVTLTASVNGSTLRDSITAAVRPRLQDIVVTPADPLVRIGATERLTATAVYEDRSTEDITREVAWRSDKPRVAGVTASGSCQAVSAGTALVTATDPDSGVGGSTRVTVAADGKAPTLQKFTLTPLSPDVRLGTQVQFKAMGAYTDKSMHEITNRLKWESSDDTKLRVDAKGRARPGLVSGRVVVMATDPQTKLHQSTSVYVEMPGVKRISVSPKDVRVAKGETVVVAVRADFHGGGHIDVNQHVVGKPGDPGVASLIPGGWGVTGHDVGETTIEVTDPNSGQFDVFYVTVLVPVLKSIVISPADPKIDIGASVQFKAEGTFSDGIVAEIEATWTSTDRTVVDVDQTGCAVAKAAGRSVIKVEDVDTGTSFSVEVTVKPPPPRTGG